MAYHTLKLITTHKSSFWELYGKDHIRKVPSFLVLLLDTSN